VGADVIDLLVVTDGRRHCLERTMEAAATSVLPGIDGRRVIVNDSLNPVYWAWLDDTFGAEFEVLHPEAGKRGFAGAIQAGWDHLGPGDGLVFHLEDDFLIDDPVPFDAMAAVLTDAPDVVQVALLRQAVNRREQAAGGLIAADWDDFTDEMIAGVPVVTHRRFFTTNPSLYRRTLLTRGWPQEPQSEGLFWHRLIAAQPGTRSAFLGTKRDWPRAWHIGDERVGHGY
jgi:hypothetical protein